MSGFLSSDDPFPIAAGSESLFSPTGALAKSVLEPTPRSAGLVPNSVQQPKQQKQKQHQQAGSSQRKRPRTSNSPTPTSKSPPKSRSQEILSRLESQNPNHKIEALNKLLKLSADHDLNYALGKLGGKIVDNLIQIYDDTIGWKKGNSEIDIFINDRDEEDDLSDLTPSSKTWEYNASPSSVGQNELDDFEWQTFCATKFAPRSLNTAMTPSHIDPNYVLCDVRDKDQIKRLEIIMMIVRNLSYVQGNVRYLTHSVGMIRILTGSLYFRNFKTGRAERGTKSDRDESDIGAGNSANNICVHAIHALSNLAPFIDTVGRRTFADLYLFDKDQNITQNQSSSRSSKAIDSVDVKTLVNEENYGLINPLGFGAIFIAKNFSVKDESFSKIPIKSIHPIVKKYIRSAFTIFPPLLGLISITTSRAVVMAALDLMNLLLDNAENHPIFVFVSDEILYQLVRLSWKNRLGPDSLEYLDPIINMVNRVNPMKIVGSYDSLIDHEVRDRAIEILSKLTGLNDDLKVRVGKKIIAKQTDKYGIFVTTSMNQPNTKLYDAIIPALTTKVGRDQTPLFAAKLLQNLASSAQNRIGIMYLQRKISKALMTPFSSISSNETIQEILLNKVLDKVAK